MADITTEQVWREIERNVFAVLGLVTARHQARTVGIVYVVRKRQLYIGTDKETWKVRHIRQNPHVSITVPIAKRIAFMPWLKIPAATITFSGTATIHDARDVDAELLQAIYRGLVKDEKAIVASCVIAVTPQADFLTYGVGVPLMHMRDPKRARGRVAVTTERSVKAPGRQP